MLNVAGTETKLLVFHGWKTSFL